MKYSTKMLVGRLMLLSALLTGAGRAYAAIDNTAYGILAFSDGQPGLIDNIVRFDLVSQEEPTFTTVAYFGETATAGADANNHYYVATTQMDGDKEIPKSLARFNLADGTYEIVGELEGYENLINDMTFDYSTSTMYAVSRINDSQSGLFTINLTNGASTRVAELDRRFFTLAATYAGELYGISFAGEFCAINKLTGKVTVIGPTGHNPAKFQTMSFDHSDGTLYWIASTRKFNESGTIEVPESFVATINLATGEAMRHQEFGDNQLAGLHIPAFAAAANCPASVTNALVTPGAGGESMAVLSWTNPALTFGGETLKSISRVDIERDGKVVGSITDAEPGSVSTFTDNIGDEHGTTYSWLITPWSTKGKGASARISAFVGRDVPASVGTVSVEKLSPNSARVYWPAVTEGANGGWTDADGMTYDVVRNPGNVAVATGLTATEWAEPGVEVSGTYTYTVTATNSCGTSAATESGPVTLGPKLGVPYSCGFDEDFGQWTPVDANADGNTWQRFYLAWAKADGAYFQSANGAGDDWLVSNTMEFEPDATYKVKILCMANGEHPLRFSLLKDADIENPLQALGEINLSRSYSLKEYEIQFTTGAEIGDCNFAIHNGAELNQSYIIIDRIEIEKLVDYNLAATAISGNNKPVEGRTYGYTVTVVNKGSEPFGNFAVELANADGEMLASLPVDEALESGASKSYTIDYTFPAQCGLTAIYGRVNASSDKIGADNTTEGFSLTVLPAGSPEEIQIGVKKSTGYYHPLNLYSKFGASLNIYAASEVGVKRGRITGIKYDVNSNYSSADNIAVKVYMANTDRTKAADGWLTEEEMTLVYEGTFNIVAGDNKPEFTFDRAFDYTGSNLALLTVTSLENSGVSYMFTYQPYYYSPLEGNNAVTYGDDNTPFGFSGNPYSRSGNSVITLAVQSGGASVTGVVTDSEGNPVEGATVSIDEIHADTKTLADGSYRFDFVPNATYTVSVSMFGYKAQEPVTLTIEDADATADLMLTKLPVYAVSGRVIAPDGTAVADAAVELNGYSTLLTVTDVDGRFEFAEVVASELASVKAGKAWFRDAEVCFALDDNFDVGDLQVEYAHFAPVNAAVNAADNTLELNWNTPDATATLSYDSGEAAGQIGFSEQIGTIVIGSAFRTPMTLNSVSWFTTAEGGPHYSVNVYIYDLSADGNPTGKVLYSERAVRNTDNQWTVLELPQPVEAPNGCFVAVNYPGFLGLGIDGSPKTHPLPADTYAFSTDFSSGDFMYFEPGALSGNLMIRAEGLPYSSEGTATATDVELPAFYRYNLRRACGYDSTDWTLVNATPTADLALTDGEWATLPAGVYRYAVTSVFPDGSESLPVVTEYVPRDMLGSVTLTVKTNAVSTNAKGAKVTLTGHDDASVFTAEVGNDATVEFTGLWRETYTLDLALPGYEFKPVEIDMANNKDVVISDLVMKEIIATPVNVSLSGDIDAGLRFTWNESGEIADDFENHDVFAVESAGEVGWIYRDADGARTFAEPDFEFPGRTRPCSFMVFNPWLTTPSMAGVRSASLPHSGTQELVCFDAYTGSDDWFISPRLTYHNDFTFSFYARGYSTTYGEVINVGYSLTDTVASSFTWVAENVNVPMQQWTKFEYTIPADARYVALNCVSPDGFMLFVDDVEITSGNGMPMNTAVSGPEVKYVVMLDGETVAETTDCEHLFTNVPSGRHTAAVKAVYASGESDAVELEFGESGLNEVEVNALSVAPNPAYGYTEVSGEFAGARLYDLSGRCIATFDGSNRRLDLSNVAPGFYILTVDSASATTPLTVKLTVK